MAEEAKRNCTKADLMGCGYYPFHRFTRKNDVKVSVTRASLAFRVARDLFSGAVDRDTRYA